MSKSFLSKIASLTDRMGRLDVAVSSLLMLGIAVVSIWGVITRYFIGDPSGWVEELSLAMFVWLAFFGLSVLARRGEIVNIEFLLHFFPRWLSFSIRKVFSPLVLAGCLSVIIYLGLQLALFSHDRYTSILRIPFSYVYLGIPLGSLFTLYHVLRHAVIGPQYLEEVDTEL